MAVVTYPDYGVGDSSLMAVFDRNSNNVPDQTVSNAGMVPGLAEAQNGYLFNSQSTSSVLNGATQQSTLKVNHMLTYGIPLWNATTQYQIGSGVNDNGNWYKAKVANIDKKPSDNPSIWSGADSGNFMLTNMSNIDGQGLLFLVNFLYPIGIKVSMLNGAIPPLNGQYGVVWSSIQDGSVPFSVSVGSPLVGQISGTNRIDTGNTDGHALFPHEGAKHVHFLLEPTTPTLPPFSQTQVPSIKGININQVDGLRPVTNKGTETAFGCLTDEPLGGSGEPHSHGLNILRLNEIWWRRIS